MHIEKVICALVCVVALLGCDAETTPVEKYLSGVVLTTPSNVIKKRDQMVSSATKCHEIDCDDGNVCTDDICYRGVCQHVPTALDVSCEDGNVCNGEEFCQFGVCVHGDAPDCDDDDPLTVDYCIGTCLHEEPECRDDSSCDDGNACTTDVCNEGVCEGKPISCNDGDACTNDSCDSAGKCVHELLGCNGEEVCEAGACRMPTPPGCYTLRLKKGWIFYGRSEKPEGPSTIPPPFSSEGGWELCPSGECDEFTYCPGNWIAYFVLRRLILTGGNDWLPDLYACPATGPPMVSLQVVNDLFIGSVPADVGCQMFCYSGPGIGERFLEFHCHESLLP